MCTIQWLAPRDHETPKASALTMSRITAAQEMGCEHRRISILSRTSINGPWEKERQPAINSWMRPRSAPSRNWDSGGISELHGLEQEACIRHAQSDYLIEARLGKPFKVWPQIPVGDFYHYVRVALTALRQHRLRPLPVPEHPKILQALVDGCQWHPGAGIQ
jgi:hypothetical protein